MIHNGNDRIGCSKLYKTRREIVTRLIDGDKDW